MSMMTSNAGILSRTGHLIAGAGQGAARAIEARLAQFKLHRN
jgi:hypothetical protein